MHSRLTVISSSPDLKWLSPIIFAVFGTSYLVDGFPFSISHSSHLSTSPTQWTGGKLLILHLRFMAQVTMSALQLGAAVDCRPCELAPVWMLVPTVHCLLSWQHPVRTFGHYIIQVSVTCVSFCSLFHSSICFIFRCQGGSRVDYASPCFLADGTWLSIGPFEVECV